MSQPYVGEVRIFAGNFAPAGWMLCQGQLLSISEFQTLFQLIGTYYGGDGQQTFGLPDLRGRVPIHQGTGYSVGESGGVETVDLSVFQLPAHSHPIVGSGAATGSLPTGGLVASSAADTLFTPSAPDGQLAGTTPLGGSLPHNNLMPYTCINYIISLFGIFPSQS